MNKMEIKQLRDYANRIKALAYDESQNVHQRIGGIQYLSGEMDKILNPPENEVTRLPIMKDELK